MDAGPGFVAVRSAAGTPPDLGPALRCWPGATTVTHGGVALATWNTPAPAPGSALVLSREVRRHDRAVTAAQVAALLAAGDASLGELMPSCGAVMWTGDTVTACTDALGFQHLYLAEGAGWAGVSTSARALAALSERGLDADAVAVQSLLGWQLHDRTLFAGVRKLAAGRMVTLDPGALRERPYGGRRDRLPMERLPMDHLPMDHAVLRARDLLRGYLDSYLDDHPDAVVQLTGGQDSRLLLSAVPAERRRGLRCMTLGLPGDVDVRIAEGIARTYGLDHERIDLVGLEDLTPAEAERRVLAAAARLELGADPLARASLDFAEASARPGPRISGLGGEVARGFYYVGLRGGGAVTAQRSHRLAAWRMFVNEAVESDAIEPGWSAWAREVAHEAVHAALVESGRPWFAATDALYLDHRMQRWAGVTESAVAGVRRVVNPMLDDRFVALAEGLATADKRGARFLARLQVALDPELAALPLDGRPPPRTYAAPRWVSAPARTRTSAAKLGRKAAQRLRGEQRPPAGGEVLAALLARRWREDPSLLDTVRGLGIFRTQWLDDVATGRVRASAGSAALVVNLALAVRTSQGGTEHERRSLGRSGAAITQF